MELFKGKSLLEFTERFKTDLDCEEYLASLKWEDGIFTASKTHNSKEYTTTQIRQNRRKITEEMTNIKQYMKLLLISLFLIGTVSSCENVVNNNTEKDYPTDSISSLDFDDKAEINNPLIGKKFYYLYKGEDDGELFLAVDDDMPTIVFINDTLMDNWNTMEGNKWIIEKIEKKDTLLTYFVKMENGETFNSLCLSYNAKKGLMYNIRKDTTFILIDSLYINKIKKIATKTEFSDD